MNWLQTATDQSPTQPPDTCEDCGGEVPTIEEHGVAVLDDGRRICSDCSKANGMGGYQIEDGDGNRIY